MSGTLKNMSLVLGLLVIILLLVNIFVFMPLMTEKPVQLSVNPAEFPQVSESDDEIETIDTTVAIKDMSEGENYIHPDPGGETIRNPFFWPEENSRQLEIVETAETEEIVVQEKKKRPHLSMVIVGEQRRQAVLDDVFVREGDVFHGYLVKMIAKEEVVLADKLGEVRIRLGVSEENVEQAPSPPGLIERQ